MLGSPTLRSQIQIKAFNLHILLDDIWSYFIRTCHSFVRMDCNAQFSETFRTNVFSDLSSNQKEKIITIYTQKSFCVNCQKDLCTNNEVCVPYISLQQVLQ